jgi:hypothetical protein
MTETWPTLGKKAKMAWRQVKPARGGQLSERMRCSNRIG